MHVKWAAPVPQYMFMLLSYTSTCVLLDLTHRKLMKNLQKDQIFEVNSVYTLSKKKTSKTGKWEFSNRYKTGIHRVSWPNRHFARDRQNFDTSPHWQGSANKLEDHAQSTGDSLLSWRMEMRSVFYKFSSLFQQKTTKNDGITSM